MAQKGWPASRREHQFGRRNSSQFKQFSPKNKAVNSSRQSAFRSRHLKSLHQTLEYANLNKIIKNRKFEFPKRGTQLVEGSQVALPDHRLATSTWLGAWSKLFGLPMSVSLGFLAWPKCRSVSQHLIQMAQNVCPESPRWFYGLCPKCTTRLCPSDPAPPQRLLEMFVSIRSGLSSSVFANFLYSFCEVHTIEIISVCPLLGRVQRTFCIIKFIF